MKVKICNTIYDSKKEPIMLILSKEEKEFIKNMHEDATKFLIYDTETVDCSQFKPEEFMRTK